MWHPHANTKRARLGRTDARSPRASLRVPIEKCGSTTVRGGAGADVFTSPIDGHGAKSLKHTGQASSPHVSSSSLAIGYARPRGLSYDHVNRDYIRAPLAET
jgi:hypothetical protein